MAIGNHTTWIIILDSSNTAVTVPKDARRTMHFTVKMAAEVFAEKNIKEPYRIIELRA